MILKTIEKKGYISRIATKKAYLKANKQSWIDDFERP